MFPEWHHAVPESAYFKVPETIKTFRIHVPDFQVRLCFAVAGNPTIPGSMLRDCQRAKIEWQRK